MRPSLSAWLPAPALWRTALAAAVAWQAATWIVGERPYFAPLAAILCTQVTVVGSAARALERTAGVAGGIVLALVAVRLVGVSAWSVGGLVLVGMAISQRLRLGPSAVSQVAVSAVLVLSLGGHTAGYAVARIVDTAIGATTAVVLQVVLFPADFTDQAERSLRRLACRVAMLWRGAGRICGQQHRHAYRRLWHRAQAADAELRRAEDDLRLAREALRLSPFRRGRRQRVARMNLVLAALDQSLRHSRSALRLLAEHAAPAPPTVLRPLFRSAAATAAALGDEARARPARDTLARALDRLMGTAATFATAARPEPQAAALALEADEWLRDLGQTARAVRRYRRGPPARGRREA